METRRFPWEEAVGRRRSLPNRRTNKRAGIPSSFLLLYYCFMDMNTPISTLNRVGKTTAKYLSRLNIETAGDLLYYFPFRYEDFRKMTPIANLEQGSLTTIKGKLELIASKRTPRRHKVITEGLVSDESGSIKVIWFNQPYLSKTLHQGDELYLSGKVQVSAFGAEMISPSFEKVTSGETTHTARLVPIYPLTGGITQKQIRFLVNQIIGLADSVPEWLPNEILEKFDLVPLAGALHGIHFPKDEIDLAKSTERLKFDELFLLQLRAELARQQKIQSSAPCLEFKKDLITKFVQALPFTLTKTQKVSAWEILQDIGENHPMNRLLSGDVGSGKTVVGAMAVYNTVLNGYQAVLMAPTEILAKQHFDSLCKLFKGLDVKVGLLTRSQVFNIQYPISNINSKPKVQFSKQKKILLENISNGNLQIIIGTHALLSEGVEFQKLGLVIVDEQHRFGVGQRKTIKEKAENTSNTSLYPLLGEERGRRQQAHFLSMTATPIPRSLALMVYGDLDVSIINELPLGRKKIITKLVEPAKREVAYKFIHDEVKKGRQVFVICPLIEEKENDETIVVAPLDERKTVMAEYKKLSEIIYPDLHVGFLHGKMLAKEKDEIMRKFSSKELDILVATSVVEVGVDIPNASVMMIEDAERFGLAQLHQFRGRVGRGAHQSFCILFAKKLSAVAKERLKFFESTTDGVKLAEKDLELRGPGDVYGKIQSGMAQLRLAKLTDREIIKKAREASKTVAENIKKYPTVLSRIKSWEEKVHLE